MNNLCCSLNNVRVLSFAQMAQGNAAVQYLADLGANVIKVERPRIGAYERSWSGLNTFINGESVFYLSLNRNQRSLTVNLKEKEGKDIIFKIIREIDVIIENYRPGVMDRLGLGYERVAEINPCIIYASASGYGSEGPYRDKPGQDLLSQSLSGLASVTGKSDDLPIPTGAAIVDIHSGALLSMGVLAALFHKQQTGEGQKVEVNLFQSAIDLQKEALTYYLNGGGKQSIERSRSGIGAPFYDAPYGIYQTADGCLALSLVTFAKLGQIDEFKELENKYSQDDAFKRRDEIREFIQGIIVKNNTEKWLKIMGEHDIWCCRVNNYDDLMIDPQFKYSNVVSEIFRKDIGTFRVISFPIIMSKTRTDIRRAPPILGEHNEEILLGLGYKNKEINELRSKGVV